eukprot:12424677-Karenia_brevis.AAC.1
MRATDAKIRMDEPRWSQNAPRLPVRGIIRMVIIIIVIFIIIICRSISLSESRKRITWHKVHKSE